MIKSIKISILPLLLLFPLFVSSATPGECAVLQDANPNVLCDENTVITDADRALGISNEVKATKDFLLSRARDLRNSKAPPTCPANIYRLNNTFAVCLSRFIKAADATYGEGAVTIVSAFRSPDANDSCGNNAAAGGAPGSNHQYGRAADVAPGRGLSLEDLQDFAKANPQLGVCFPYVPRLTSGTFYDPPHMALAGINTGEARYCAQQGITNYCDQSPTYDPNEVYNIPNNSTNNTTTQTYNTQYTPQSYQQYNPFSQNQAPQYSYSPQSNTTPYQSQNFYSPSSYNPNRYSGIYGPSFYNPSKSKFSKLIEENPDEYLINTENSDITQSQSNTQSDNTNERIVQEALPQQFYTAGGDPLPSLNNVNQEDPYYTQPQANIKTISYQKSQDQTWLNTDNANPKDYSSFIEIQQTNTYSDTSLLPDFIPYNKTEPKVTSKYDDFDPNNRPPDWVDNSFYEPQPKSWWSRFISLFGF